MLKQKKKQTNKKTKQKNEYKMYEKRKEMAGEVQNRQVHYRDKCYRDSKI